MYSTADDGSGCGFSSLLQLPDNAFLKGLTLKKIFVQHFVITESRFFLIQKSTETSYQIVAKIKNSLLLSVI